MSLKKSIEKVDNIVNGALQMLPVVLPGLLRDKQYDLVLQIVTRVETLLNIANILLTEHAGSAMPGMPSKTIVSPAMSHIITGGEMGDPLPEITPLPNPEFVAKAE